MIRAIILGVMAAFCHSIMTLLVKLTVNDTPESMTVFFRFTISLFWIISVLIYKRLRGKQFPIKTKHLKLHILRATSSFIAILALYCALEHAPLVNVSSLSMTYTLFIPILSLIFFGTKTNIKNWLALFVGFVGIIFILRPHSGDFNPMILMALISGLATAGSLVGVYELAKDDEPYTIMLYYFPLTFILSSVFAAFNWQTPDSNTLMILLMVGVAGTAYQELVIRSMLYAPPKIVAPLLYFSMIFSGLFDWLFWHHVPGLCFWFGATLVTVGCIFSIKHTGT